MINLIKVLITSIWLVFYTDIRLPGPAFIFCQPNPSIYGDSSSQRRTINLVNIPDSDKTSTYTDKVLRLKGNRIPKTVETISYPEPSILNPSLPCKPESPEGNCIIDNSKLVPPVLSSTLPYSVKIFDQGAINLAKKLDSESAALFHESTRNVLDYPFIDFSMFDSNFKKNQVNKLTTERSEQSNKVSWNRNDAGDSSFEFGSKHTKRDEVPVKRAQKATNQRSMRYDSPNNSHLPAISNSLNYSNITMWKTLSSMSTPQFLSIYNIKPVGNKYPNVYGRSYKVETGQKMAKHQIQSVVIADQAHCVPRVTCIEVENEDSLKGQYRRHGVMYWPSCIEIERCSGCCLHRCLKCSPTEVSRKQFTIFQLEIILTDDGPQFNHTLTLNIKLDKHEKCECGCNRKIPDCRDTHCK